MLEEGQCWREELARLLNLPIGLSGVRKMEAGEGDIDHWTNWKSEDSNVLDKVI